MEQCLEDTDAAIRRLFNALPEVDAIDIRILECQSETAILTGRISRSDLDTARSESVGMRLKELGVNYNLNGWHFESPHLDQPGSDATSK